MRTYCGRAHIRTPPRPSSTNPAVLRCAPPLPATQVTGDVTRLHTHVYYQLVLTHNGSPTNNTQPQVTGDVIRLHTHAGGVLLPAPLPRTRLRPRPLLSQRTVDYLLPPQVGRG